MWRPQPWGMGEENVEALADAVEDWKQTRYHLGQLLASLGSDDVDLQAFKEEFVSDRFVEQELIALVEAVHEHRD